MNRRENLYSDWVRSSISSIGEVLRSAKYFGNCRSSLSNRWKKDSFRPEEG